MNRPGSIAALVAAQRKAQRGRMLLAAIAGGGVTAASVTLLGLSGWFIAGAAMAGGAGMAAAHAFNFLLPSAIIRLLAIVRTGARYIERVSGHDAALQGLARLRPQIFAAFAGGRPEVALGMASGEAAGRLVQDVDALQTVFIRASTPWALATGAATAILLAGLAHPMAGAAVLAGMALSLALNAWVARRLTDPAGTALQRRTGEFRARLAVLEAAAPELKAYGLSRWAEEDVAVAGAAVDQARGALHGADGWAGLAQACVTGLCVVTVMMLVREATVPLIALAALAAVVGVESTAGLAAALRQGGAASEATRRLDDILLPGRQAGAAVDSDADLEIGGVLIAPGGRLALVGASGSGKTTLVERLVGLRDALPGEWRLGGRDRAACAAVSVRRLFSYAAQDVRLLEGSVRRNLLLAAPDATDADMWRALEDAALAARIREAAEGLDLHIGPDGARLSGGERRRLALARAYLRPAPWLVLDEPTEGLDAATEQAVLDRLARRLAHSRQGLILISHRPTPVALCERVLRIRAVRADGRVDLGPCKPALAA